MSWTARRFAARGCQPRRGAVTPLPNRHAANRSSDSPYPPIDRAPVEATARAPAIDCACFDTGRIAVVVGQGDAPCKPPPSGPPRVCWHRCMGRRSSPLSGGIPLRRGRCPPSPAALPHHAIPRGEPTEDWSCPFRPVAIGTALSGRVGRLIGIAGGAAGLTVDSSTHEIPPSAP